MSKAQIHRIENYDSSKPIRIWLGNLAKYNEGRLVGAWLSLPMDEEALKAAIAVILGKDEEWLLNDFECDIPGLRSEIHEHSNPFDLNKIAESVAEVDEFALLQMGHLLELGYKFNEAIEKYEDVTVYQGMRIIDVAEELVEDGCFGEIPESIAPYIDYEAIARDLEIDGYTYDPETRSTYHYIG